MNRTDGVLARCGSGWCEAADKLCDLCRELEKENAELVKKLSYARNLGIVYRHPDDWSYAKNGGGPTIEDCESVDLSEL